MDWSRAMYVIVGLLVGAVFHEYMHGKIADMRGDPTARNAGRLTLNPVAHIDPFGTVLMPIVILLITQGGFAFGYAKPVPVNPFFLRNPRRDMTLVALSGPLTNFAIALIVSIFAMLVRMVVGIVFGVTSNLMTLRTANPALSNLFQLFFYIAVINVVLGFFNLIPVPPLDGSHVLEYFLPSKARRAFAQLGQYGFVIIILFIYLFGDYFFGWMNPIFALIGRAVFGLGGLAM